MDRTIKIAKGDIKAELVIKNANIINVFTNEIIKGDVAIDQGVIVGVGDYFGEKEIDLEGKYLSPGFIDGHVHIESSKVTPGQFAKAVLPRGTTTIVADPHEIANVKGQEGIRYMLDASEKLPLEVYMMLPSCVPSTPYENSGAVLGAKELKELIDEKRVLGLGEMMDYTGVIQGDEEVLEKLTMAKEKGKMIDGHGPGITGRALNAYIAAGVKTEHECSTVEEMIERLRLGMVIQIREGSATRNLKTLIQAVNKDNLRRIMFCTDDKEPSDLLNTGSIDHNIRLAIQSGLDPIDCIKMASLNPAEIYGLTNVGAIAPGYQADLVVLDNLEGLEVSKVFKAGELVAEGYKALFDVSYKNHGPMKNTVNIGKIDQNDLKLSLKGQWVNIMKLLPHSLITEKVIRKIDKSLITEDGDLIQGNNILKVAVIERHKRTGNVGLALVEGFGLENGAIASTVAHDSHNLIVIGDNDEDILLAVEELRQVGGGITLTSQGKVLDTLPLSIAGLMSEQPLREVEETFERMNKIAYEQLKVNENIAPFMTLSFIALPVIPKLKVTDQGLFDVEKFEFIDLAY